MAFNATETLSSLIFMFVVPDYCLLSFTVRVVLFRGLFLTQIAAATASVTAGAAYLGGHLNAVVVVAPTAKASMCKVRIKVPLYFRREKVWSSHPISGLSSSFFFSCSNKDKDPS